MAAVEFADNNGGYEKFYALVNNLEGIFAKVNEMKKYKLDISYYEEKLEELKKEFNLQDEMLKSTNITFENMRIDLEIFALSECNKKLEKLTIEFENNITPIYNMYLLSKSLDKKFKDDNNDDLEEVISKCMELMKKINNIPTHNNIDIINLYEKTHETILNGLLYEAVYNRHDLLEFIKNSNNSHTRETLGKLIRNNITKLLANGKIKESDVDNDIINNLNEGLGYDFLSNEFIELLSKKNMSKKYEKIESEKEETINDLKTRINKSLSLRDDYEIALKNGKATLKKKMFELALARTTLCALALSPAIIIGVSGHIGRTTSEKITEYATITREVNLSDNSIVGEEKKEYDDAETSYVATITTYEPWKKNPTGVGYIRNCVAYEYVTPENVGEDYHISEEDIKGNIREKYRYVEAKDQLSENDSMTDSEIHVTETYQNKNDSRKSTRYIIPGYIIGSILSIIEQYALFAACIYQTLKEKNDEANEDKKKLKDKNELLEDKVKKHNDECRTLALEAEKLNITYNAGIDVKRLLKK